MDKNTQQQASWEYFDGTWHVGVDGERENYEMFGYPTRDLHTAPPVPRDVLMAACRDVLAACEAEEGPIYAVHDGVLAAIADRYASQVQPEPVNQQTLAALKALVDMDVAYQRGAKVEQAVEAARAAIAAAEAAQTDHIGGTDKMVHAEPYELNCDDIERLRIALSWEGYSTPEGLEQCAVRWPELVRDLIRAVLSRKKRAQQPASAQQVAVPDGYVLVPIKLAKSVIDDDSSWHAMGYAKPGKYGAHSVDLAALLSAAPKPEGV